MHIQWSFAVAGMVVGFLVGITGMGGGALSTPILIFFFKVDPTIAVGTDLLYTSVTKAVGTYVHAKQDTLDWRLVKHLALGSVPGAIVGVTVIQLMGGGADAFIKRALAIALLLAASAIVARRLFTRGRSDAITTDADLPWVKQPMAVTVLGFVAGVLVGLTSVGSGTIIVAVLLVMAPGCGGPSLVGSDIAHGAVLTGVAGLASASIGHVNWGMFLALLVGSIPMVIVGSKVAGRLNPGRLRPILVVVLALSAYKMIF